MNSKVLFLDFVDQIKITESREELQQMGYILLEHLISLSKTDILLEKEIRIGELERAAIEEVLLRVNRHEPLQYIVGYTQFYGRNFLVDRRVLIPRPETEELARWIVEYFGKSEKGQTQRILDIGTGSGCIAITLALALEQSTVSATDVAPGALEVARRNATELSANVQFLISDILTQEIPLGDLDLVVSNPPYVARQEIRDMQDNVVLFEPHLALFVPDDNPLLFYQVIAEKAGRALRRGGLLAVEINERFGKEVVNLFAGHGFTDVGIIRDVFGKERIVKGFLS